MRIFSFLVRNLFEEIYKWAFAIGSRIINQRREEGDGKDLVKRLVFDIRGEETPGRFLDKLSSKLSEYRTNVGLNIDVGMHSTIFEKRWSGDSFHYLKSAILSGLANSLMGG